jgi:hypothetical protein
MAMASSPLLGSCGCGAIRFEISEPLVGAAYCHCHASQKRTGTAVQASAAMAPGSLTITAGRERLREWAPPNGARRFVPSAAEWEPIPDDGVPRYDGLLPWR